MRGAPTRGKAANISKIIELYQQGFSMNEIGKRLGHHHGVIAYHIHKSGIEIHNSRQQKCPVNTNYIKELYGLGMSTIEIGEHVSLTPQSIYNRLLKSGVKLRSFSEAITLASQRGRKRQQRGELNSKWKGGRYLDTRGYILLWQRNSKPKFEHRLIWEQYNGRLPDSWVVHHLNGIKNDNRIENLYAMPRKAHSPLAIVRPYQDRINYLEKEIKELKERKL